MFEELGGKIVQKMFPPLTVPDYGTYLAQLKSNVDGIFLGFAGANGFRYLRQFNEYGLMKKVTPVGGMTALDEAVLRNMGDEALGIVTSCWYSAEIENAINKRFVANFRVDWKYDPGFYAAATYTEAAVLEEALNQIKGNDRGQAGVHEGGARHQEPGDLPRAGVVRPVRQRGRQRLHPQGRAQATVAW